MGESDTRKQGWEEQAGVEISEKNASLLIYLGEWKAKEFTKRAMLLWVPGFFGSCRGNGKNAGAELHNVENENTGRNIEKLPFT